MLIVADVRRDTTHTATPSRLIVADVRRDRPTLRLFWVIREEEEDDGGE